MSEEVSEAAMATSFEAEFEAELEAAMEHEGADELRGCHEDERSARLARSLQEAEDAALAAELAEAAFCSPVRGNSEMLNHLPDEIVARVLSFASSAALSVCKRVCRRFSLCAKVEERARMRKRLEDALVAGFASDELAEGASSGQEEGSPASAKGGAPGTSAVDSVRADGASTSRRVERPASRPAGWLEPLASRLEAALHDGGGRRHRSKGRQLLFNLRDPKNPTLRSGLACGEVDPWALVRLEGRELRDAMAGDALRSQRREWKRSSLERVVKPDWRAGGFVCDLYRCNSCHTSRTNIHRTIRAGKRAVDEVSTLWATCIACNLRWAVDQA